MKIFRDSSQYFGILGNPLSHTLSPLLHEGWYQDLGLDCAYFVFPVTSVDKNDLRVLRKFGVKGLSVTIPHKETAYDLADKTDPASQAMQASNTLVLGEDGVHAFNTDGLGAVRAILESAPDSLGGNVLVLGSGGSARGIGFALLQSANVSDVTISSRNEATGTEVVRLLNRVKSGSSSFSSLDSVKNGSREFSLVVHTTPLGMKGQSPGPILDSSFFRKGQTVFDIVYNPLVTPLVEAARSSGATIIPGTEMLLYQAVEQFRLFTGIPLGAEHVERGRQRLLSALKTK
ncbi:shikimate dehydrogenase [Leptospira fluminis]|uniref:Shikimate dehydrogenase (NADP(+)) n=1 Tax=Leptospira fluminis TaxID=2484979 RepID=A0A4R9GU66_9LEPT|nr:shikimate dehydrogenase [Leptospira fluminis]TGK22343.1 shikimate dehydrogenase [Leptospira fluminis]